MQKLLSALNESTIVRRVTSDFSHTEWMRIAIMKKLFGDYLAANGKSEAAAVCWQLAVEYESCIGLTTEAQRSKLIDVIAPLEGYARTLY